MVDFAYPQSKQKRTMLNHINFTFVNLNVSLNGSQNSVQSINITCTGANFPTISLPTPNHTAGSFHVKSPNGFNPYLFDFAENWYIERP